MTVVTAEKTQLQVSQFIKAKKDRVFKAWTDVNAVMQWFCPTNMTVPFAEIDAREGGNYRIQMKNKDDETFTTYGVYQEIRNNEKLVFTWGWEGPDREETLVTVEFFEKDEGTEVILTHSRFTDSEMADKHQQGWNSCLDNLNNKISVLS